MTQQLTGGLGDLAIQSYHDLADAVFQQRGSVLRPIVRVERVLGQTTWFPKIGSSTSYEVVSRGAAVEVQDQFYERRGLSPTIIESVHRIDKIDLERFARSPQPELAESIAMELGRQVDIIITNALLGTAQRQLNGVESDVAFSGSYQILTNSNLLAGPAQAGGALMTGNTSLHEGKILQAIQLMATAHANDDGEMPIVVGNAKQFSGLRSRILAQPGAGWFQKSLPDLHDARIDGSLDGFLGCRYIQYEGLPAYASGYDSVIVMLPKAIKLGIYSDMMFRVDELPAVQGTPTQIKANITLGAVRFYEEAVVQIECNQTLTYA